ncbi:MAG: N-acetylmuramoyl-L-alanine amidase [Elusimicrobiota bacterium]|jgi:N-acetylmuramoyl-L-alanine amidase
MAAMMLLTLALILGTVPASAADAGTGAGVAVSTVPAAARTPELRVVWPAEGARYPYLRRSFVFGTAGPGATLAVNGSTVPLQPDGAFLAMAPFSTGTFALRFEALREGATASLVRTVQVAEPFEAGGMKKAEALEPHEDLLLLPGDWLFVRARGPAGVEGRFRVGSLAKDRPLVEVSSGVYEGRWRAEAGDLGRDLLVEVQLRGKDLKLKDEAPGKVTVRSSGHLEAAVTAARSTILRSGSGGYSLFLPPGIALPVSGRAGGLLRVPLAPDFELWADTAQVRAAPEGSAPAPGTVGRYLGVSVSSDAVKLSVAVDRPLPFEVSHRIEPFELEVRFFGARQRLDRVRYAAEDPVLTEVVGRQEGTETVRLLVRTRLRWSAGYGAYYEKGRFVLELRRPPDLAGTGSPLKGRRVVLDPGHGPDRGALGPRGSEEQNLNLALAFRLKSLLEAEGAEVFLTRASSAGPALADRAFIAWDLRGDVLLSIHNNSIGVEDDPFASPLGYMTLYYQPQSRPLAEAVHASYRRLSPLPDNALVWGDLAVCRATWMPAVLTESAYVLLPEQEAMLLSADGQERFARQLLEGLRSYFEAWRKVQKDYPDDRRAVRGPTPPRP